MEFNAHDFEAVTLLDKMIQVCRKDGSIPFSKIPIAINKVDLSNQVRVVKRHAKK
jgi:hypothetical protein